MDTNIFKPSSSGFNLLKNIIVTPQYQKAHQLHLSGNSLASVLTNKETMEKFKKHELPKFSTIDGKVWVKTHEHVFNSNTNYLIKWLFLNEKFEVVHNHSYPDIPIPLTGYLAKIVLPDICKNPTDKINYQPSDYEISFVINIANVQYQEVDSVISYKNIGSSERPHMKPETNPEYVVINNIEAFDTLHHQLVDDNVKRIFYQSCVSDVLEYKAW